MIQVKQPDLKLKFYADTPAGQKNKLFVYKINSYVHAIDLAAKFVQEHGFKIRAAYFQVKKLSIRFDDEYNLNEWTNSLIEKNDIEKLLSIEKQDSDIKSHEMYLDSLSDQFLDSNKNG